MLELDNVFENEAKENKKPNKKVLPTQKTTLESEDLSRKSALEKPPIFKNKAQSSKIQVIK